MIQISLQPLTKGSFSRPTNKRVTSLNSQNQALSETNKALSTIRPMRSTAKIWTQILTISKWLKKRSINHRNPNMNTMRSLSRPNQWACLVSQRMWTGRLITLRGTKVSNLKSKTKENLRIYLSKKTSKTTVFSILKNQIYQIILRKKGSSRSKRTFLCQKTLHKTV